MVVFILLWLYLFFTFQVCPFFWSVVDKSALDEPFYFYVYFIFCLFINFIFNLWKEKFNNNSDFIYRFFSFLLRPFSYILTYLLCEFKKFVNFILLFKYKKVINLISVFFKKALSISGLIWRPVFKKWSYFGYFRSNKSKWYKK